MPILGIVSSSVGKTAYESIASTYVTSATPFVEFGNIPSTYKHLQVRMSVVGNGTTLVARYNGDTGSNYSFHRVMNFYNDTAEAAGQTGRTTLAVSYVGANNADTQFANVMDIFDYTNNTTWTSFVNLNGIDINGAGGNLGLWSGMWFNSAIVNTIRFFPEDGSNIFAKSRFALYGIKG